MSISSYLYIANQSITIHSLPLLYLYQKKQAFLLDLPKRFHSKDQLQISNFKQREKSLDLYNSTNLPYPSPSNQIVKKKLSLSGSCFVLRISFTLKHTLSLSFHSMTSLSYMSLAIAKPHSFGNIDSLTSKMYCSSTSLFALVL